MTLVIDASFVVAALIDSGRVGQWAEATLGDHYLAAPHLLLVESANVLRRAAQAGSISGDVAALAHGDLIGLRVELIAYEPCAERVWELRENLTAYDAWYVASAELLDSPLATLDGRLVAAPGPRCPFVVPEA